MPPIFTTTLPTHSHSPPLQKLLFTVSPAQPVRRGPYSCALVSDWSSEGGLRDSTLVTRRVVAQWPLHCSNAGLRVPVRRSWLVAHFVLLVKLGARGGIRRQGHTCIWRKHNQIKKKLTNVLSSVVDFRKHFDRLGGKDRVGTDARPLFAFVECLTSAHGVNKLVDGSSSSSGLRAPLLFRQLHSNN